MGALRGHVLHRPRRLLGLACLVLALLPAALDAAPSQTLLPGDAARAEGGPARVAGMVHDVRVREDTTRVVLMADGQAVEAVVEGRLEAPRGAWAIMEGRLLRLGGDLRLLVEGPDHVRLGTAPHVAAPAWSALAEDPGAWQDRPVRLAGLVERGELWDRAGHRLRLGEGPWPADGAVEATGTIGYDPACLCHRFHAIKVGSWTP